MMKRVLESLLYDWNHGHVYGYRDDQAPVPSGWHRIHGFHHNYGVTNDYHFSTESLHVDTPPYMTIWSEKAGADPARLGDNIGVGVEWISTPVGSYIINTRPRWFDENWNP